MLTQIKSPFWYQRLKFRTHLLNYETEDDDDDNVNEDDWRQRKVLGEPQTQDTTDILTSHNATWDADFTNQQKVHFQCLLNCFRNGKKSSFV